MIKANDLIHNGWYMLNGKLHQYDALGNIRWQLKCYEPIPLTPEILVKAGFENFEDGWYSLFDFTWNIYDKVLRWMGVQIKCHDLHQLQNLYFALTGEELNIEL
jgi:hypothetical protein